VLIGNFTLSIPLTAGESTATLAENIASAVNSNLNAQSIGVSAINLPGCVSFNGPSEVQIGIRTDDATLDRVTAVDMPVNSNIGAIAIIAAFAVIGAVALAKSKV
jgi:hypothetical protein